MKILVVEDEPKVTQALKEGLAKADYKVTVALTGEDGLYLASSEDFDVVVLDIMLPGRSGLEILKALRKRHVDTPVLILTARDTLEERIQGLDSGADDYLVKPFAFPELLARIRALLRRGKKDSETKYQIADLEFDLLKRKVSRSGKSVDLTLREFELLEYMFKNQDQLVSREMLAREVWHEPMRATSLDNVIDVHMVRLRKKIDHGFEPKLIHTIRGVGFVLREEE